MKHSIYTGIICLKTQPERYQSIFKSIKEYSSESELFGRKVDFMLVEPHPTSGRVGCYESHLELYGKAIASGCDYALIFEDDVVLTENFSEKKIQDCLTYLNALPLGWDILRLSQRSLFCNQRKLAFPGLSKAIAFTGECYIVPLKTMIWMLNQGVTPYQIDWFLTFSTDKGYLLLPSMVEPCAFSSANDSWSTWFPEHNPLYLKAAASLGQKAFNHNWTLKAFLKVLELSHVIAKPWYLSYCQKNLPLFNTDTSDIK